MKTFIATIAMLMTLQERVSPDLLDYQPGAQLKGALELGPPGGFEKLLLRWADRMKEHYPDLRGGKPLATNTTTPQALITGTSRIGIMSRRWTDEEFEEFHLMYGYHPTHFYVAGDAIAILVHPENPLKSLTLEQVDATFSSIRRRGGKPVKTWGDLGLNGDWRNQPVRLYGLTKDSPMRASFTGRALLGGGFVKDVQEVPTADALVAAVAEDPCAIGYARATARTDSVRAVPLTPLDGSAAVEPQSESILGLTYPLSWRISLAVRKGRWMPEPEMTEFLRMVLSRDGQVIVAEEGLVPVTGRFARKELAKLK